MGWETEARSQDCDSKAYGSGRNEKHYKKHVETNSSEKKDKWENTEKMKNNERDTGGTPAAQRDNGAQEQQQQQEQQDTDPKHTPTPDANLAPTALHARHVTHDTDTTYDFPNLRSWKDPLSVSSERPA